MTRPSRNQTSLSVSLSGAGRVPVTEKRQQIKD